jgi:hypothetical protein
MPSSDPASPVPTPDDALRRLEEGVAFLGRDVEHVAAELKDVWARLVSLERRVARLEQPPEPGESEPDASGSDRP